MNIAMLWYDPDPKTKLSAKIARAIIYYSNKYGAVPNTCNVKPKTEGENTREAGIIVVKDAQIDLNYLWIGVKNGKV